MMHKRSVFIANRWLCVAFALAVPGGPAEGAAQAWADGITAGAAIGRLQNTRQMAFHASIPLMDRFSALGAINRWREVELLCTLSCGIGRSGWSFGAGLRTIPWRSASRLYGIVLEGDAGVHDFRDPGPPGGKAVLYFGGRLGLHRVVAGAVGAEASLRVERTSGFDYVADLAGTPFPTTAPPIVLSAFELRLVVSTGNREEGP